MLKKGKLALQGKDKSQAEESGSKTCCCFNLDPLTATKLVGCIFLVATALKVAILVLAYHDVLPKDCCVPYYQIIIGLTIGVVEVVLYLMSGVWLIAASFKMAAVMFVPPLIMLSCVFSINTILAILMAVSLVWVDAGVRALITLLTTYSLWVTHKAKGKLKRSPIPSDVVLKALHEQNLDRILSESPV